MATDKVRSLPRPKSAASKIFELFKETESYTILGPHDERIPILFRSLDYGQNAALVKEMDLIRAAIKDDFEAEDLRAGLTDQVVRLTREKLLDAILSLERPLATEQADLAPGADPEAIDAAKKEQEAVVKWEEARKTELEGMEDKDLRTLVVDRQTRLLVNSRLLGEFMNSSLVHMVLDPETQDAMFSADAFECAQCGKRSRDLSPTAEICCGQPMEPVANFIGRLAPQIREQLVEFRRQFTMKKDEKEIRKVAESNAFLPSGESATKSDDFPGAMIETQATSQPASSPSIPEGGGSTA